MQKQRRYVLGWCLYDWANSAFATVMLTAVLPPYFLRIAPDAPRILGFTVPADSLWAYTLGISAFFTATLMPVIGAAADRGGLRYRFWIVFTMAGVAASGLTGITPPSAWLLVLIGFVVGNIGFEAANVFYNALLMLVVSARDYERLSAWGFASGYVGGGLALAGVLLWVRWSPPALGIPLDTALRQGLLATSLWWGGFALLSFGMLRGIEPPGEPSTRASHVLRQGWNQFRQTFREIRRYRGPLRFLVAFLLYNDGVQTTIVLAAVYGRQVLHIPETELIALVLMVQFLAFPGAVLWAHIARRMGTYRSLEALLLAWILGTASAWFIETSAGFWGLAAWFALILGGIQALSRAYFAHLVPRQAEAEFFAFYSVTAKFSAIAGPIWVGLAIQWFGSMRYGILGLIVFYLAGWAVLRTIPRNPAGTQLDTKAKKL